MHLSSFEKIVLMSLAFLFVALAVMAANRRDQMRQQRCRNPRPIQTRRAEQ